LGPETAHSPNADDINALYWVMVVVVGAILVAVNGALIGLVVRYRRARGS
jgi:heme/copper-type cytochrome/quinol oxidase subunit 2